MLVHKCRKAIILGAWWANFVKQIRLHEFPAAPVWGVASAPSCKPVGLGLG